VKLVETPTAPQIYLTLSAVTYAIRGIQRNNPNTAFFASVLIIFCVLTYFGNKMITYWGWN
jgi:hypothetical protein